MVQTRLVEVLLPASAAEESPPESLTEEKRNLRRKVFKAFDQLIDKSQ
jgi:hypothetical protein